MDYHVPVLAHECVHYLNLRPGGVYVDVTFGGGGHSRLILEQAKGMDLKLFGFDQDEEAKANALADERFTFVAANFRHLRNYLRLYGIDRIDGLLADLGVSSHQFDQAERGFSYRFDAPLDMRMGKTADRSAADVVNHYEADELQKVFGEYGEVRNARTLAQAIVAARERQPIASIQDFLNVCDPLVRGTRPRYLAQVFQALRIEVNDEIGALSDLLAQATDLLIPNQGRLVVIAYHSLEDRITKNFLKTGNAGGDVHKDFYGKIDRPYQILTKKPVLPSAEEIRRNSRARSAKLRVGERSGEA
ncbi:16S rRNA (cytosine(1402)-N(4))-methyltransferase RsmH [Neolewinella lacunae]|uniref:Ribosomal RNA small subunit methyltransferase H n=1 Tax=Neolewinella lacunae TaxID=1517758 RepID=A0A923T8F4_9BACT|nr:16S rRNA (cytosine(1402)-N(4))-methyltransferase RsmH [Neolewinella lacunae]MBC6994511.1 16S rRNA (cytosine(1402)-N(4))-methyltransferase RsmH [Neolewinella lacunae]MDN3634204.1 16S rRNA (cytosine(1402)-N(4))-methyltransferase RsmH [Neolewinella lacunae]